MGDRELRGRIFAIIRLIRVKQWIKNGFVLAPLLFAGTFLNPASIRNGLAAFALFCIAASATYVLNDIRDVEADRRHPVKSRKRPLAAGELSIREGWFLLAFLWLIGIPGLAVFPSLIIPIAAYLILNVLYTLWLKHQPVFDIFSLALGFVIRVYAGAIAIEAPVSNWMLITVLCLALYLGVIKRRQELTVQGVTSRGVLGKYSVPLLDRYAEAMGVCAIVFYGMFTLTVRSELEPTIPFVIFGFFRYWFVVDQQQGGESPTDLLYEDKVLAGTLVAYLLIVAYVLYPK